MPVPPLSVCFWDLVVKTDGCWLWTRRSRHNGRYCYHEWANKTEKRVVTVERFAYELQIGPIPAGHTVVHTCGEKRCVRPDHLALSPPSRRRLPHPNSPKGSSLFSPREIDAMRRLRKQGVPVRELAECYGVCQVTIRSLTKGCSPGHRASRVLTLKEEFEARRLRDAGVPPRKIAARFGVSAQYISQRFPRSNRTE